MIAEHHYSRYPVYQDTIENIIGIIHTKDCFSETILSSGIDNINSLLRPALKINTNEEALDLLPRFQEGMTHFALVYKEERLVGFLTLDNLLQALVGKIRDEFHRTK